MIKNNDMKVFFMRKSFLKMELIPVNFNYIKNGRCRFYIKYSLT